MGNELIITNKRNFLIANSREFSLIVNPKIAIDQAISRAEFVLIYQPGKGILQVLSKANDNINGICEWTKQGLIEIDNMKENNDAIPSLSKLWKGYERHDFLYEDRATIVVLPKISAPGNP